MCPSRQGSSLQPLCLSPIVCLSGVTRPPPSPNERLCDGGASSFTEHLYKSKQRQPGQPRSSRAELTSLPKSNVFTEAWREEALKAEHLGSVFWHGKLSSTNPNLNC